MLSLTKVICRGLVVVCTGGVMMRHNVVRQCLILLSAICSVPVVSDGAEKRLEEVTALIEKARQTSDICAEGSAPFRLKARCRFLGPTGPPQEGSYTLTWVSEDQWRKEIVFPDYSEVKIRSQHRIWLRSNPDYAPWHIWQLDAMLNYLTTLDLEPEEKSKVEELQDRKGGAQRCAVIGERQMPSRVLCFDPSAGTLTRVELPYLSLVFSHYQMWNGKMFPRVMEYSRQAQFVASAYVIELTSLAHVDTELFMPPSDSHEEAACAKPDPPRPVKHREPRYSDRARAAKISGGNVSYAVIGRDGKVLYESIVQPLHPDLDAATLQAIKKWEFQPAMCAGEPVQTSVIVETSFKLF